MHQIKIIYQASATGLEKQVNDWLRNTSYKIVSINVQYMPGETDFHYATIIYQEDDIRRYDARQNARGNL